MLIVQPDTLPRWHLAAFRLFWRRKSMTASRKPKIPAETVQLIQRMALENRLWGAGASGHSMHDKHYGHGMLL